MNFRFLVRFSCILVLTSSFSAEAFSSEFKAAGLSAAASYPEGYLLQDKKGESKDKKRDEKDRKQQEHNEPKDHKRPDVKEVPRSRRQERPSTVKKDKGHQKK
ncbi:hypothetical protein [Arcticibacter sp. MXS-1]|uniref:hypothetical protein n=1 Tax=Arcticibacter sp. MXS-1 TaxID=3341726 RepID=UPI0035A84EF8